MQVACHTPHTGDYKVAYEVAACFVWSFDFMTINCFLKMDDTCDIINELGLFYLTHLGDSIAYLRIDTPFSTRKCRSSACD